MERIFTTKQMKILVAEIYGDHWRLKKISETRTVAGGEFLWDTLVFASGNGEERVEIYWIDELGYSLTEYSDIGDVPYDWSNCDKMCVVLGYEGDL